MVDGVDNVYSRLARPDATGRTEADIQSDIRQLLLGGRFNLDVPRLEEQLDDGTRRRIDIAVGATVIEVHPEVSFAAMAGAPVLPGKRTEEGVAARLDVLRQVGLLPPSVLSGSGYGTDDVLDAVAVAWTAHRYATGAAHSLPDPPETASDGIAAAIWV